MFGVPGCVKGARSVAHACSAAGGAALTGADDGEGGAKGSKGSSGRGGGSVG